jgi:hypothetical protein
MREYDLATVCRWIGNSPAVAARHYATSVDLDADFRRAAGFAPVEPQQDAQQKAQQSASVDDDQPLSGETPDRRKRREKRAFDTCGHVCASAARTNHWAIQDSNL